MEEIKVNEYIRTEDGIIAKCTKIEHNRYEFDKLCECYTDIDGEEIFLHDYMNDYPYGVIKAKSTNITDLIEVGDILEIFDVLYNDITVIWNEEILKALREDIENGIQIKSVTTKEQFNSIKYVIGE